MQAQYAATLKASFGAEAAPLESAAVVNAWVDKATRGKISEIIDEGIASQASGWSASRQVGGLLHLVVYCTWWPASCRQAGGCGSSLLSKQASWW